MASWIIRDARTKKVVFETFNSHVVDAINRGKYEVVPIAEYPGKLNAGIRARWRDMADKFTPGPWSAHFHERNQRTGCGDWFFAAGGHNVILGGVVRENKTAEANARLIAAAPELVAALQTAEMDYADLERYMRAAKESAPMMAIIAARRAGLRALLARIEGDAA